MYRDVCQNLSAVARECGVPVGTLWRWVQTGKLKLPEDFEMAKSAKKVGGRWYLKNEMTGNESPGK
jgi:transposase-like protein